MTKYIKYCDADRCICEVSATTITPVAGYTIEAVEDSIADKEGAWVDASADLCTIDWSTSSLSRSSRLVIMGRKDLMTEDDWTALVAAYPQV